MEILYGALIVTGFLVTLNLGFRWGQESVIDKSRYEGGGIINNVYGRNWRVTSVPVKPVDGSRDSDHYIPGLG